MRRQSGRRVARWVERWGFAVLVASAIGVAASVASSVTVPSELPGLALRAAPIYRLEVGAAIFLGLYLASMTFVLALNNRGFSEIGMRGVKAQDLGRGAEGRAIQRQEASLRGIAEATEKLQQTETD